MPHSIPPTSAIAAPAIAATIAATIATTEPTCGIIGAPVGQHDLAGSRFSAPLLQTFGSAPIVATVHKRTHNKDHERAGHHNGRFWFWAEPPRPAPKIREKTEEKQDESQAAGGTRHLGKPDLTPAS